MVAIPNFDLLEGSYLFGLCYLSLPGIYLPEFHQNSIMSFGSSNEIFQLRYIHILTNIFN